MLQVAAERARRIRFADAARLNEVVRGVAAQY
jgi:hypothetical protein